MERERYMNIFFVDSSPEQAAHDLPDKLAVKMPLETAQILSTVLSFYGGPTVYRPTHEKHPSVLWVKESKANWDWLVRHGLALCDTYRERYGKTHACRAVILQTNDAMNAMLEAPSKPLTEALMKYKSGLFTEPPRCMPVQYRSRESVVESYRAYLIAEKTYYARWKKTSPPAWWTK